ncbi:hypothetical protein [Pararhodonellum marinum]|uniref:hypothetical protein n=1 Tax=Pararhodonellum marinum TaxID=2755358 RepID=UPI00188E0748|nr:hypothetical protein [Pararhodonellum marinum]
MTADKNKGITNVIYNILDRPQEIQFGKGEKIINTYSADGALMTQTIQGFPTGNKSVEYVGELVFANGVLTDINHELGRVLANNGFKYQYYLTDHLGSTRVVLQEDPDVFTTSAGFETESMEEESGQFIGYEEAVRISADMLNHTPGEESMYAMRLSGGYRGTEREETVRWTVLARGQHAGRV